MAPALCAGQAPVPRHPLSAVRPGHSLWLAWLIPIALTVLITLTALVLSHLPI